MVLKFLNSRPSASKAYEVQSTASENQMQTPPVNNNNNKVAPSAPETNNLVVVKQPKDRLKHVLNVLCCNTGLTQKILMYFVDNDHPVKRSRIVFISFVAFLYNCFVIPLRSSFFPPGYIWWWVFSDALADIIYVIDIILEFRAPYEKSTTRYTDFKHTARKYASTWFIVDLLTIMPLDWISFAVPGARAGLFRINRLLKITYVNYYFDKIDDLFPFLGITAVKLARFVFYIVLVSHIMTCIWYLIFLDTIALEDVKASSWLVAPKSLALLDSSIVFFYLSGLYQCLVIMSGFSGTHPHTELQVWFHTITVLIGIAVYTTIIGIVRSSIANTDSNASVFQRRMDEINDYMKYREISRDLQSRVATFYNFLWKSRQGLDEAKLLEDLPDFLREEVSMFLNKSIIEKVDFFNNVQNSFLREVVKVLKPQISLPGSEIIRVGETGAEMFFINKGSVEVEIKGKGVVATLGDGKFFGEMALINNQRRVATIRAKTHCDLFMLTKVDLDQILEFYPNDAVAIREAAAARQRANAQQQPPPPPPPAPAPTESSSNLTKQESSSTLKSTSSSNTLNTSGNNLTEKQPQPSPQPTPQPTTQEPSKESQPPTKQ